MSSANRTSCYDRRPAYSQKVRRMGPPQVTQWSEPLKPSEPLKAETLWEYMVVGSLISAGEDFFYVPCLPLAHTHYNCTLFSLTGVCSSIGCQTFHDLFTMWMHDLSRQQEPDSMNWRMTPTRVVGLKKFMFPQWSALVMWLLGHNRSWSLTANIWFVMCRNVGCIHWDSAEHGHQHRMVALESTYDSGKCNSISISTNCKYIWWWDISKRSWTISSRTLRKSVGEAGNGDQQANWTLARGNREAGVVHGCWSHQVTWNRVGRDKKGLIDLMSVFVRFGFIMVLESILSDVRIESRFSSWIVSSLWVLVFEKGSNAIFCDGICLIWSCRLWGLSYQSRKSYTMCWNRWRSTLGW